MFSSLKLKLINDSVTKVLRFIKQFYETYQLENDLFIELISYFNKLLIKSKLDNQYMQFKA